VLYNNIQIQSIDRPVNLRKKSVYQWLNKIANNNNIEIKSLSISICSDEHLLSINKAYLNHDYYTDIITFDLKDSKEVRSIEGDIYISKDRVNDNAKTMGLKKEVELLRVIVHGLLHLMGYKDKTQKQRQEMREAENLSINLYETMFHVK
jgi:rRNA maturation RNase YbeY